MNLRRLGIQLLNKKDTAPEDGLGKPAKTLLLKDLGRQLMRGIELSNTQYLVQ